MSIPAQGERQRARPRIKPEWLKPSPGTVKRPDTGALPESGMGFPPELAAAERERQFGTGIKGAFRRGAAKFHEGLSVIGSGISAAPGVIGRGLTSGFHATTGFLARTAQSAKETALSAWNGAGHLAGLAKRGAVSAHAAFRERGRAGMNSTINMIPGPKPFTPELHPAASPGTPAQDGTTTPSAAVAKRILDKAGRSDDSSALASIGHDAMDAGKEVFDAAQTAEGRVANQVTEHLTGVNVKEVAGHAANVSRIAGLAALRESPEMKGLLSGAQEENRKQGLRLGDSVENWKSSRAVNSGDAGADTAAKKHASRSALLRGVMAAHANLQLTGVSKVMGVKTIPEMKMKDTVGKKVIPPEPTGPVDLEHREADSERPSDIDADNSPALEAQETPDADAPAPAPPESAVDGHPEVSIFGRKGGLISSELTPEQRKASEWTVAGKSAQGVAAFGKALKYGSDVFGGKGTNADKAIKEGDLTKASLVTAAGLTKEAAATTGHALTGGITTGGVTGMAIRKTVEHVGTLGSATGSGIEELGKKLGKGETKRDQQRALSDGSRKKDALAHGIEWAGAESEEETSMGRKLGGRAKAALERQRDFLFPPQKALHEPEADAHPH